MIYTFKVLECMKFTKNLLNVSDFTGNVQDSCIT